MQPAKPPLPPMQLRLHRDTDERFLELAGQLAGTLYRCGLRDDDALLDVGCGIGRLPIGLLENTSFRGRYVGFDVNRTHVRWARRNLTPVAPAFRFRAIDVRNARYNPEGEVGGDAARFPVHDARFDVACLFSVFTHFEASDIAAYLRELHRSLKPGGTVVATWFLWDEARRHDVETGAYPMVHERADGVLFSDAKDPLWAIAHHVDRVRSMIGAAGLEIERIELGTWAHGPGPEFQDLVIMRKPVPPRPPWHRRLRRRLRRRLGRRLGRRLAAVRQRTRGRTAARISSGIGTTGRAGSVLST